MRRPLLLTLLSLSLMALGVQADQVTLKNGDRLSGSVVKTDDDAKTLLIKTELAGDVIIPWDVVTGIVSSQPLHITLSDGRVIAGTVSTAEGKLEVATKDAGTVSAAYDAVKRYATMLSRRRRSVRSILASATTGADCWIWGLASPRATRRRLR